MSTQLSIQATRPARLTRTDRLQLAVSLRGFAQRDFAQRHDGQMPTPFNALDDQLELCNTPSGRPGACSRQRIPSPHLHRHCRRDRRASGGAAASLGGRQPAQSLMRTMPMVPTQVQPDLSLHLGRAERRHAKPAVRKETDYAFSPPLDPIDGAARVLDPLFLALNSKQHPWGIFFKDYRSVDW